MNSLFQTLTPIDLPLSHICLDPNNPRFVGSDSTYVQEADWASPDIQETAQRRLIADYDVEKLRMNMEVNGYLPIDRVIVKKFATDKYLVLEGNRRICAAKQIGPVGIDGSTVSNEVLSSLENIPCLLYTGTDSNAAWVFQGLRHIAGVTEWSAYNKARLLVEQMERDGLSLTDVGRRFGLTPHGAGQWVRGYNAFNQARQASDYVNEVDERSYPYFQELFGRSSSSVREWMEWSDATNEFQNKLNLDEFISWLYPRPNTGVDDGTSKKGDFENRRIARRDDIRQIAELLSKDKDIFEQFRTGATLEACYSMALARRLEDDAKNSADLVQDLFKSVEQCKKCIANVPHKAMKNAETRTQIEASLSSLEAAITEFKEP